VLPRFAFVLLLFTAPVYAEPVVFAVRELAVDYTPFSVIAQPGELLDLPLVSGTLAQATVQAAPGVLTLVNEKILQVSAPEQAGLYPLSVQLANGDSAEINLFVTVPATAIEGGLLNGYRIGPSPAGDSRYPELYQAPVGFIEVNENMLDTPLSPHFKLRQFLCKQESGYPKYVVVKESLLALLEGLLAAVRERGYPAHTFGVISAYRTPWYNKMIENVANSRHVYGDAMDLYIDLNGDSRMDDLDGDGDQDLQDVVILAEIADEYMRSSGNSLLLGGVGRYRKTRRHGGFIHVDTRGYIVRW
jgi:hypothetical protein